GFMLGSAFPGAVAPRGLCKVGPDTSGEFGTVRFLHFSGYWYPDNIIQSFTHLHLHGTGAPDYGVLGMMPLPTWDEADRTPAAYASRYNKDTEAASPGYYAVTLNNGGVVVELTATEHAAHHRYTFAADATEAHVLVDLDKHLEGGSVRDAEFTSDAQARMVRGRLRSLGAMSDGFGGYDVWFALRARQPWTAVRAWSAAQDPAAVTSFSGTGLGFVLDFPAPTAPLEFQVGISLVSADGALANLETEMPDWDFDSTRAATRAAWTDLVDRIQVIGGTDTQRRIFHTAVYHPFLMPTHVGDADGRYRSFDGTIRQADGFTYVNDMSLWDTYRTMHPLMSLMAPADNADSAQSLLEMARAGGYFPKWPIATGESSTMLGAPAEIVVADACVKGVPRVECEAAWLILRAAALDSTEPVGGRGGRGDVVPYMDLGYVPASRGRAASQTIEYAYGDFALANLAAALGHDEDAAELWTRAQSWRNAFDPAVGFVRNRNDDGTFPAGDFSPTAFTDDYAEANAWQTTFGALHDPDGLALLLGGREAAIAKLTEFMQKGREDFEAPRSDEYLFASRMRPYFWPSNQPSIHVPYLFALLGRPDLTQEWVRWTMAHYYADTPEGLPGNDDGGTMSAWYVFSALGFYPLPGSDVYVVGTPLFRRAAIRVGDGVFTVEADGVSDENLYVQAVRLNGAVLAAPTFRHADLRAGGTLRFTMGPAPSSWGR
ncbi:MAG: glycoside hydrolase family 92 protein, partial [Deltaproteobacteria bacterium]|nr:glycoside hydrolase family 92 protein [Deltaproteobacteria bacterium]